MVTAPSVPAVVAMMTVPPLTVKATPVASFRLTVTTDVAVPLARILVGLAVIVEFVVLATGAVKTTEAVFVLVVLAPTLKETVAVVTVVLLIKVAVYVPLLLSVTGKSEPEVVVMVTVPPLLVNGIKLASRKVTVMVEVDVPFAVMLEGLAVIRQLFTAAIGAVKVTVAVFVQVTPFNLKDTTLEPMTVLLVKVAV